MATVSAVITPAEYLEEIKAFLGVTGTQNDAFISSLISFATLQADNYLLNPFVKRDPCTDIPLGGVDCCTKEPLNPVHIDWINDPKYSGILLGVKHWLATYFELCEIPLGATAGVGIQSKKTKDLTETYFGPSDGGSRTRTGIAAAATQSAKGWWCPYRLKPWR